MIASVKRQERRERTRRRIVEAAVELHSTIGPARTSYSAVARQAGVSRPTLYAYFPHEEELFRACSAHGFAVDPPPDPRAWMEISDPIRRLVSALTALYAHFRRNEGLMSNLVRDASVTRMRLVQGRTMDDDRAATVERLAAGWTVTPGRARRLRAALAHAAEFTTWQSLTRRHDLDDREAVQLMVALATAAAASAPTLD
jgi:AcrR family transcriptional regulator